MHFHLKLEYIGVIFSPKRSWFIIIPITYVSCLVSLYINLQSDEVATAWLNNDGVRSAIHAEPV